MRIGLSGPQGVGKTTLANDLAQSPEINFISCSARETYKDFEGIRTHADVINKSALDHGFARAFQTNLLYYREQVLRGENNFVTDRTPWDNMVYYALECMPRDTEQQTEEYLKVCVQQTIANYDWVFLVFPFSNDIENDGVRNSNVHYRDLLISLFIHYESLLIKAYDEIGKSKRIVHLASSDRTQRVLDIIDYTIKIKP